MACCGSWDTRFPVSAYGNLFIPLILYTVFLAASTFFDIPTLLQDSMLCGIMRASMASLIFFFGWINLPGWLGLIRWGIVIHGFIDGYSRLITGLHASDNNTGQTVLDVFQQTASVYGVPNCVENILVAAWMEEFHVTQRGSYIWGQLALFFILYF